jgi:hypothetical protein
MITEFGKGLLYGDAALKLAHATRLTDFNSGVEKLALANTDKRRLTNAQRALIGLPPRRGNGQCGKGVGPIEPSGLNKMQLAKYRKGNYVPSPSNALTKEFSSPPAARMEAQLHEMFAAWPEWVRLMNAHHD